MPMAAYGSSRIILKYIQSFFIELHIQDSLIAIDKEFHQETTDKEYMTISSKGSHDLASQKGAEMQKNDLEIRLEQQ